MTVLSMSRTEIDRVQVLKDLLAERILTREAAHLMGFMRRQAHRLAVLYCAIQSCRWTDQPGRHTVVKGSTYHYKGRSIATTTSIKLDDELKGRVQQLAQSRRRTAHWIMREAITQYVEREEKREALRQDTLKAWEEFEATGLHAKAEDVEKWLSSWGTENELPTPVCHK